MNPDLLDCESPTSQTKHRTMLVVVIPCLNEEQTVADVVRGVPREMLGIQEVQVLVVDDGSSDATSENAAAAGASVLRHATNLGLGRTFQDGIDQALAMGADYIVNIDGDGQFNPSHIPRLLRPLTEGRADFATASRFADPSLTPQMPAIKRWGNARIAWLVSLLTRQKFADVSCGFRAYTREVAMNLNLIGRFTYTQETFLDLVFKGFRITEVPMEVRGVREFGESRIASNLWNYAMRTALIIFRTFRDYRPLLFFGAIASTCGTAALLLFAFLAWHYLSTGSFSPHIWAGMTGGFMAGCALLIFTLGQIADMLSRHRMMQDRMMYLLRDRESGNVPASTKNN